MDDAFGVYDCVDDYAEQAVGTRGRAHVAAADRRAAADARLVFATTRALARRHSPSNPKTFHVGNVADFAHFARAVDQRLGPPQLASLPRPVLGFAGNIAANKVDVTLLGRLADNDRSRSILIAGPVDPSLEREVQALTRRENVTWIGPVPYAEIPAVVSVFDVGVIPYLENSYTRNVFPLKLFEYLAAGKPVLATGLPELAGMEPDVRLVRDGEEVEAALADLLTRRAAPDVERRQAIAARNTWDTRTERLLSLIEAELGETGIRS
jgi:glycosyltransferase involved in cell wall biosynthesis